MKALPCLLVTGVLALCACDLDDTDFSSSASPETPGQPPVTDPVPPMEPVVSVPPGVVTPPPTFPSSGAFGGTGGIFGGLGGLGPTDVSGKPIRLSELRTAANPPPPISGGTLAVSSTGDKVVVADPDRDTVFVVEPKTLKVQKLSLPHGSEPGRVAFDAAGGAHVVLRGTGKLLRVDLASASISTETPICTHPRGVAFDAKNSAVVTTCMDGQVVVLDPTSHQEKARQSLESDLRDVVVSASGARWVSRYRTAELLTFANDSVKSVTRPNQAFRTRSSFPIMVPRTGTTSAPLIPSSTQTVTLSPALAWRTLPGQRGGVWMLHQQSQDEEVVVSRGGYGSGCQAITSGAVTEFSADGTPGRSMPVNLEGLSVDAALSPDEKWLAVASPGGFARSLPTVQIYATANATSTTSPGQCANPQALTGAENQTVAVAFDGAGVLYALSREPAELQIYELRVPQATRMVTDVPVPPVLPSLMRIATIALDLRSARDTGHDLFHADVGQGLSCASCHGEALDDAHVWTFEKIGPRRTQNMRGGFLATAPFHWDGDMKSMSHLVDDVMTGRMGGFPVELSFATALGQWLQQQPALTLPARDPAAASRGKTLFESAEAACSTCHSGANFTNNQNADVGTGGSFQVPSLLGLALRAPYMHNGCAKTLRERFDPACGGGDAHGKTSQLSEAQLAELIGYLNTL